MQLLCGTLEYCGSLKKKEKGNKREEVGFLLCPPSTPSVLALGSFPSGDEASGAALASVRRALRRPTSVCPPFPIPSFPAMRHRIEVGLLMGRIIFRVFGLGCYVKLFGWKVMGLQDKWVGMEWVC